MTDRLSINGWMVAEGDLEHGYAPYDTTHRVAVFRHPEGWATLTLARDVRRDDDGQAVGGTATVTTSSFSTLAELADYIEGRYRAGAWRDILDAGHQNDPDLHAAWVPEQMARVLDQSSIFNKDLAHIAGYFDPGQLGAPGRALPGWQAHALGAMAATLNDEGWDVPHDQDVTLTETVEAGGLLSASTEIVGTLRARRYGWEAAIIVRVDDAGEIYARLADPEDVTGPALRRLTAEDE